MIDNSNRSYPIGLAELVEMTLGAKPETELQRLTSAKVIGLDSFGLRFLCHCHR